MKPGNSTIYIQPTPILNYQHPLLARFSQELLAENPMNERSFLQLADRDHDGFTNATDETLFEAVSRTAVDWYGQTSCSATDASCDLSSFVLADEGIFPSRDAVFDRYGLFIHQPEGCFFELIFGRRKAAS